ncbi:MULTISPECIES: DUF3103 family protein [unclassified Salinivibrio]|uniref:DUF3103 family protein n=1 Tax=unclassified Salinivibrio TaxID=2636825 RepID=UPI000987C7CA|nr:MULTISPECIES: DUF3103 family protein [unclassified Salinivibrio]OOF13050.1 hypothetical protein BZG83_09860 [Salinivibrio sp. PR919]OOF18518.1 hypothetical protein BZG84_03490 [Salinivibrio sp. PR932]
MNKKTLISLLFAGLTQVFTPAFAGSADNTVVEIKRDTAKQLSHQYELIAPTLHRSINSYSLSASLSSLTEPQTRSARSKRSIDSQLYSADRALREAQGVEEVADQLLEVRLADPSMLARWQAGQSPLFAFEPAGDEQTWTQIEAFDIEGNTHWLDVYQMPDRPVLVVDTNGKASLKAGLEVMRRTLAEQNPAPRVRRSAPMMAAEPQPIHTTVLKTIRLEDDKEPWISGAAEVYAIVTGVNPSRDEPTLDIVDMPYLDYDKTTYHPNQVMIHWERYRWGAADVILMEQDDGTNYKELALKLNEIASDIIAAIPDLEVQAYGVITKITGKIIEAIPDGWLTNDDDFVDVYYTLLKDRTYQDHIGAGGNATATWEPLVIEPTK